MSRLYIVIFLSVISPCVAQQAKPDTAFVSLAKKSQVQAYNQFIHGQTRLNNGSGYRDYYSTNDEHPYFGEDDWSYGTIVYDDEFYEHVPMFYDISSDNVVSEHSLNGAKLVLIAKKIKRFELDGHTFVRLQQDELKTISEGFYDLLYDGKTKVYVRRAKTLEQKTEPTGITYSFAEKNRVYILKAGIYYPVKSKGSVLEVFKDQKQQVKSFMNKNKINLKADREGAIARIAEFYDAQNN